MTLHSLRIATALPHDRLFSCKSTEHMDSTYAAQRLRRLPRHNGELQRTGIPSLHGSCQVFSCIFKLQGKKIATTCHNLPQAYGRIYLLQCTPHQRRRVNCGDLAERSLFPACLSFFAHVYTLCRLEEYRSAALTTALRMITHWHATGCGCLGIRNASRWRFDLRFECLHNPFLI